MTSASRPCERLCPKCGIWKYHGRFRSRKRPTSIGVGIEFNSLCRDCEQIERNERKNDDRARAIIERRAADHARKSGVAKSFFMVNMNYAALVPMLRVMMTPEGRCLCCGHPFLNERDIQIEHREPPRHPQDWARLHARNLGLACQSCNGTKGRKSYALWLDEQEEARLSNQEHRATFDAEITASAPVQMTIEELLLG